MATITFRMNASKDLIATTGTKIYQNESNMDTIAILLPCTYNDMDLAEFTIHAKYVDLLNTIHDVVLERDEEVKDNYFRFSFVLDKEFTKIAGKISFAVSATKDGESEDDGCVLHTGTGTINILPWKDYKVGEA